MPTRQPGRRAIIVASIIGLIITLIWAATFRQFYLSTHPLGTWEQSTCRDTASDASNTSASDELLVGIQAEVPPGGFRGALLATRTVMCGLRASDGALMRRFLLLGRERTTFNNFTFSPLWEVGDTLYITTNDGRICAIHATDGKQMWCHTTQQSSFSSELIVANGVVFRKSGSLLEAFDARDGTPLWNDNLNDGAYVPPQPHQPQTFVASGGSIYVGRNDPTSGGPADRAFTFCARAARTGTPNWCQTLGTGQFSIARVEQGNGIVFAFLDEQNSNQPITPHIYALRTSDGKVLWHRQLDCAGLVAPLMAFAPDANQGTNGTLLVATPQCDAGANDNLTVLRRLIALRPDDGTPLWTTTPGAVADLAVVDGVMYLDTVEIVSGESTVKATTVLALRVADASQVWHFRVTGLVPKLVLKGDTIYVLTGPYNLAALTYTQTLYALRRADGGELWQSTGCGAVVDPAFWHDRILQHEQGAPVWCHWLAGSNNTVSLNPALP